MKRLRAQFITHRSHLNGVGGVQMCTNEYLRTLSGAGVDVDITEVTHDASLPMRVLRRFNSSPYVRPIRADHIEQIIERLRTQRHDILLFNQVALAGAASLIAKMEPVRTTKIALSHGCEITDMLHVARLERSLPLSARLRPMPSLALGFTLADEMNARRALDGVVTLSPFDAETERWMGMPHVGWLPRMLTSNPLDWTPQADLFGYVGTLDHAPNLEGLVNVLDAAGRAPTFRLQVVGGAPTIGAWLASKYSCVEYLGALSEADVRLAARKWNAFIHPIFCQARGCSTKLATALDWGIPIVTTELGRRGYEWSTGNCVQADTPALFLNAMLALREQDAAQRARADVITAACSGPPIEAVAAELRSFIDKACSSASTRVQSLHTLAHTAEFTNSDGSQEASRAELAR